MSPSSFLSLLARRWNNVLQVYAEQIDVVYMSILLKNKYHNILKSYTLLCWVDALGYSGSFPELVINVGRRVWWLQVLLSGAFLLSYHQSPPLLTQPSSPLFPLLFYNLPFPFNHYSTPFPLALSRTRMVTMANQGGENHDNHLILPLTRSQAQSWERSKDHDEYCPALILAWIFICLFFQFLGFYNLINTFMIRNIFKHFCGILVTIKIPNSLSLC